MIYVFLQRLLDLSYELTFLLVFVFQVVCLFSKLLLFVLDVLLSSSTFFVSLSFLLLKTVLFEVLFQFFRLQHAFERLPNGVEVKVVLDTLGRMVCLIFARPLARRYPTLSSFSDRFPLEAFRLPTLVTTRI